MPDPSASLTLLQRRELEAQIVGPLIRAFIAEFGRDRTLQLLEKTITNLAHAAGSELASQLGTNDLAAFSACLDQWRAGGALEIELLEQSSEQLSFNVTRCQFAEMYHRLGLADLGGSLSCCRDSALVQGFSPQIKLTRTQTIMQGASCCDFRFRTETPDPNLGERD